MIRSIASGQSHLKCFRGILTKISRTNGRALCVQVARNIQCKSSFSTLTSNAKHLNCWSYNFVRAYSSLPQHIRVALPALSPTMEQGTIISWEKKEGDKLNEGDLLAEIETDKATMGFETPEEGYLAKIVIAAGTKDVPVGKLVCIIVENQGDVAAFKDFKDDSPAAPRAAKPSPSPPPAAPAPVASEPKSTEPAAAPPRETSPPATTPTSTGDRVYASPMAKKLAEAQALRLEGKGSGVHGSIKSTDLADKSQRAAGASAKASSTLQQMYKDIPVSNVRNVIAKRLKQSKQEIPHYYVTVECQLDTLEKMREKLNKRLEKEKLKVSVNDFVIKATATACRKVPEANSYWMETFIRQFDNVDVSVAVSTPSGLITPIVFSADRKGIVEISKDIKALAGKARENKLQPHEFQGGTVCVSNLGMFGVDQFCAVINPPQSCILAVGTSQKKIIADSNNPKGFKEITVMKVTLSADHRVVDGAVAAQWLKHFREFIEDPSTMIV
jgi:pyruvate dehydrogenase E2 component (dihydrolipoamide acetyltransferase)